jgi:hypothetical protein
MDIAAICCAEISLIVSVGKWSLYGSREIRLWVRGLFWSHGRRRLVINQSETVTHLVGCRFQFVYRLRKCLPEFLFVTTGCATEISVDLASPTDYTRETIWPKDNETCNEQKNYLAT